MNTDITKVKKFKIRDFRFYVQIAFALLCVWIGVEFYFFVQFLNSGGTGAPVSRPPGVDGFLPISSFMSFYLFLKTGEISLIHPAGFFIFTAIVVVSLIFGKSFCSWFCPVGFLSELLGDLGEKIFRRKLKLPKFLDSVLRSLKYLLLAFFVYSIVFLMTDMSVKAFLEGPYNVMADVKMYYFFADISRFSIIVLSVLVLLSIVIRGFWCRFLCPYGAFLGITSLLSPNKIKRNSDTCINCEMCTKVCPSFIKVHKVDTVVSDECTSCMSCIDVCPVNDTLELNNIVVKKTINKKYVAYGVILIFIIITGFGMITGYWKNKVTMEEYIYYHQNIEELGHPTDPKGIEKMNEDLRNNK